MKTSLFSRMGSANYPGFLSCPGSSNKLTRRGLSCLFETYRLLHHLFHFNPFSKPYLCSSSFIPGTNATSIHEGDSSFLTPHWCAISAIRTRELESTSSSLKKPKIRISTGSSHSFSGNASLNHN